MLDAIPISVGMLPEIIVLDKDISSVSQRWSNISEQWELGAYLRQNMTHRRLEGQISPMALFLSRNYPRGKSPRNLSKRKIWGQGNFGYNDLRTVLCFRYLLGLENRPNSVGIVPLSLVFKKKNTSRFESRPISVGMLPEISAFRKASATSNSNVRTKCEHSE